MIKFNPITCKTIKPGDLVVYPSDSTTGCDGPTDTFSPPTPKTKRFSNQEKLALGAIALGAMATGGAIGLLAGALLLIGCISGDSDENAGLTVTEPKKIADSAAVFPAAAMAWDGNGYGLGFVGKMSSGQKLFFARLDAAGSKIGGEVEISSVPPLFANPPALAWNASTQEFILAWDDRRETELSEIFLARLNATGQKMDGDILVISADQDASNPALVVNEWNQQYGLGWLEDAGETSKVRFTRLDDEVNSISEPATLSNRPSESFSLIAKEAGYAIGWIEKMPGFSGIQFARLDSEGKIMGETSIFPGADPSAIAIASAQNVYGVVWYDRFDEQEGVHFIRINNQGTILEGREYIGHSAIVRFGNLGVFSKPQLSANGENFGASWVDEQSGVQGIYFTERGPDGQKWGETLTIAEENRPDQSAPAAMAPLLLRAENNYGVGWFGWENGAYAINFSRIQ